MAETALLAFLALGAAMAAVARRARRINDLESPPIGWAAYPIGRFTRR